MKHNLDGAVVCIVGLGHVGLALAEAFAKSLDVIGFDIDGDKVKKLNQNNNNHNLHFTNNRRAIRKADFTVVAVPTPVTKSREPDLSFVESAAKITGQNMKKGSTVILESTVYPSVTEEIVKPILERESGLKCGVDFRLAYSPERISPGDEKYTIERITKVVAAMDEGTTNLIAELYHKITPHIHKAKDIRTAEAAKMIENIQRDLNIALMNELAIILGKMGLSTKDVLDAAATKWNFHLYSPGLVGGHCIPINPYYLVYKAKELGYHPQVILAGRAINDFMPKHIVDMAIEALNDAGKAIKDSKILIMGLTYKENVTDFRGAPVKEIIKGLKECGVEIYGYDPLLDDIEGEFEIKVLRILDQSLKVDGIVLAVAHKPFQEISLSALRAITNAEPVLIDVPGMFDKEQAMEKGFHYRNL